MRKILLLLVAAGACYGQFLPAAVPMPTPVFQAFDFTGAPLAFGKLCTYAAGTNTPLTTYTDATANSANTNPVLLDASGKAPVFVGASLYKFVLRQGGSPGCSTGVTVWSQDNIGDQTLYFVNYVKSVGTAALITYTAPGVGGVTQTVSKKLSQNVNAADYGALCDASTDDAGAINAAITALGNGGGTVDLPQGGVCAINSTVTIPATYMVLNCRGSELLYKANSGDAVYVAPYASSVPYISGGMKDCYVHEGTGSPGASNGIHQQSRLGFKYERIRIRGFSGSGGAGMYWENTDGGPGFNEQNSILSLDTFDNSRGLKLHASGGTNSFHYNDIYDWHCGVNTGQYCLSLEGTNSPDSADMFGGILELHVNGNGTNMRTLSLTGGTVIGQKVAIITGELTSGGGPLYSLYVDSQSYFQSPGYINVAGGTTFAGSSQTQAGTVLPTDPVTGAAKWEPSGGIQAERHCKYMLGDPNANPANSGNAVFWLSNFGGVENNCFFQIKARATDASNKDVNVTGSGSAPVNILYTDSLSKRVGIGVGWSESTPPVKPLDVTGDVRFSGNLVVGGGTTKTSHIISPATNSDMSFIAVIGAGSISQDFTFAQAWNALPNCVATPNTALTGAGGSGLGQFFINPTVTKITVQVSNTQGNPVTFFVHCLGNPN